MAYFTSPTFMATVILTVIAIVLYIVLTFVRKKHRSDPEFIKKQEEAAEAYRKKMREESELDEEARHFGYPNGQAGGVPEQNDTWDKGDM